MSHPLLTVDAFTNRAFAGNPAGVCLLDRPAAPEWMQRVAAEMNLSETAFLVPGDEAFALRWFTPTTEVALCGHATLASAHALWDTGRVPRRARIAFDTASGRLHGELDGDQIVIELPWLPVVRCEAPAALTAAFRATPESCHTTRPLAGGEGNYLLVFAEEGTIRELSPDWQALAAVPAGVIVTAPGADPHDFVSRYFAVPYGIDEDPVTGSAHCSLAPYWAGRLGRTRMRAYQASSRGGELTVTLAGDRVRLGGHAVTVLRGEILV